jgi:hypothetical protein
MKHMRRLLAVICAASGMLFAAAPALAHEGGHAGGCEDFGHVNGEIARGEVTVPGYEGWSLGEIVSSFAVADDGEPGVGDVVRDVDHLACG